MPSEERLRQFYEAEYRQDYKKAVAPHRRHVLRAFRLAAERFEATRPFLPASGRALDIGAGGGEWVTLLGRLGYRSSGIEPTLGYAEYAKAEYGAEVVTAPLNVAAINGTYDVVTAFHVLEHLPDPREALARLRALLSSEPTARIVVEVPNVATVLQSNQSKFHFAHVIGFTPATLAAVAARAGLALVADLTRSPHAEDVRMVFARGDGVPNALPHPGSVERTRKVLSRRNRVHVNAIPNLFTKTMRSLEERALTIGRSGADIAHSIAEKTAARRASA